MPVGDYMLSYSILEKEVVMELYLFLAMFLIYVLTAFMVKPHVLNRIWSLAFVVCFAITAVAIAFIRISGQDVMMSANELNWYYLLYLFGSLSVVLGIINLWMYRAPIFRIFFSTPDEDNEMPANSQSKKKGLF